MKKKTRIKKIQREQRLKNLNISNESEINKEQEPKKNKLKKNIITGCIVFLVAFLCFSLICSFGYYCYLKSLQNDKLFKNGVVAVKLNDKWGYINSKGKTVLDFKYDYAYNFSDNNLALVSENGKFGYINKKGEYIIDLLYEDASPYFDGMAICKKDGKYGAINSYGNTSIEFEFDNISKFCGNYAIATKNNKMGIIDKGGKTIIDFEYESISSVNDNFYIYRIGTSTYVKTIKTSTDNFYKKEFQEATLTDNGYCIYRRNGLYGLIGAKGIIFDEKYATLTYKNSDDYLVYSTTGDYYGYIDFKGKIVLPEKYLFASTLNDYAVIKYSGDELYYVINDNGKDCFSLKCDMIGDFNNKRAYFKSGENYGVVNSSGKILCEAKYKYISKFYDDGFAIVTDENGHFGVITASCKVKIAPIYDNICIS